MRTLRIHSRSFVGLVFRNRINPHPFWYLVVHVACKYWRIIRILQRGNDLRRKSANPQNRAHVIRVSRSLRIGIYLQELPCIVKDVSKINILEDEFVRNVWMYFGERSFWNGLFHRRKENSRNNSRKYWVRNSFYVHTQIDQDKIFQNIVGIQAWEEGKKFQLLCGNIMKFIGPLQGDRNYIKFCGKLNLRQQNL